MDNPSLVRTTRQQCGVFNASLKDIIKVMLKEKERLSCHVFYPNGKKTEEEGHFAEEKRSEE